MKLGKRLHCALVWETRVGILATASTRWVIWATYTGLFAPRLELRPQVFSPMAFPPHQLCFNAVLPCTVPNKECISAWGKTKQMEPMSIQSRRRKHLDDFPLQLCSFLLVGLITPVGQQRRGQPKPEGRIVEAGDCWKLQTHSYTWGWHPSQ